MAAAAQGLTALPTALAEQLLEQRAVVELSDIDTTSPDEALTAREREVLEVQFSAGLRHIEAAFQLAEAKDPKELRAKTIEFWQKSIDCMRQTYETQLREFQAATARWTPYIDVSTWSVNG